MILLSTVRRLLRKPGFWIVSILGSFLINIFIAWKTVHSHLLSVPSSSSSSDRTSTSFFWSPSNYQQQQQQRLKRQPQDPPIHENVVWHRILQQEQYSSSDSSSSSLSLSTKSLPNVRQRPSYCHLQHHPIHSNNTTTRIDNNGAKYHRHLKSNSAPSLRGSVDSSSATSLLLPGRFRYDVESFVQQQQHQATTTSRRASTTCFLPPSSACEITKYSVVILSSHNEKQDWRQLLLNIASFKAYPSVSDITLIMSLDIAAMEQQLGQQGPYFERIVNWVKTKNLFFFSTTSSSTSSSLWDIIQNNVSSTVKSDAILWIDMDDVGTTTTISQHGGGTIKKDWTGSSLKQNFELLKANPQMIVASGVNVGLVPHKQQQKNSATSTLRDDGDNSSNTYYQCSYPNFHQLMIHKNFLCYVGHPIMNHVKQYHDDQIIKRTRTDGTSSWKTTLTTISMIWNHVANGHTTISLPTNNNATTATRVNDSTTTKSNVDSILDYLECECSWPSTTSQTVSSLNSSCN